MTPDNLFLAALVAFVLIAAALVWLADAIERRHVARHARRMRPRGIQLLHPDKNGAATGETARLPGQTEVTR